MTKSRHELETEALAKRLRAKNSAGSKAAARGARRRTGPRKKSRPGRATRGQGSFTAAGRTVSSLVKIHAGGLSGDAYMERQAGAVFIDSNMLGQTARERAEEWRLDELQHPGASPKNLFVHQSVSRPAGHRLIPGEWQSFALQYLKKIDAEGCKFIVYQHPSATRNDHIHIVFSRSKPDGTLVSTSNNFWRWRAAAADAARELGLEVPDTPAERPAASSDRAVSAERRSARRQTPSPQIDRAIILEALSGSTSRSQFESRLTARGVEVKDAKRTDGTTTGLLFRKSGADEFLAGSSIDRSFSLPKIDARLEQNRRQLLLKQEQQVIAQRQRESVERQRQAAQVQRPRKR